MNILRRIRVYLTEFARLAHRRTLSKSYFNAAAVANNNTRFLQLPRELRNMIYEYVTCDVRMSVEPTRKDIKAARHHGMWLRGTTDATLLRVCQQIRAECMETRHSKSRLCIELELNSLSHPFRLALKPAVKTGILCHVKRLEITLRWHMVLTIENEHFNHWVNALSQGHPLPADWSPAKVLRSHLDRLLNILGSMLHPSAAVTIQFRLDGFLDPDDPYEATDYEAVHGTARMFKAAFDIDTIFGMETDRVRSWPQSLEIVGCVRIPLYSGLAENSAAVMANRLARERGETEYLLRPNTTASKVMTVWSLRPYKLEGNWKGFWPTFVGTEGEGARARSSVHAATGVSNAA
ncbi:hypothetical protein LTR15_006877 [Elasticomyces elasticus]|nr:hypothetical protein LTR15_006877 [Elasticomyces elasticus]